jgi:hypothetical protein
MICHSLARPHFPVLYAVPVCALVCTATWHGKRVACKIMQLPATGPFGAQEDRTPSALMAQNAANSAPHMAIMEAVVSSTVSHPNVNLCGRAAALAGCCPHAACAVLD